MHSLSRSPDGRIHTYDFINFQVLPYMAEGALLADSVALIGTIDNVLESVDG